MPRTIADLLDLPERVHKGDFVLDLSRGVIEPEKTVASYVLTAQLEGALGEGLEFIRAAVESSSSKASYLHGSFGAGKSHFMAILHLLLARHPAVLRRPEFHALAESHRWTETKTFLPITFHLIGASDLESAVLGRAAEVLRERHPDAPALGVYRSEALFENARGLRERMGDEVFFAMLSAGEAPSRVRPSATASTWSAERFEKALAAPPKSDLRTQLVQVLVARVFTSFGKVVDGKEERYLSLDDGLSVLSRHARDLGYDAVVLFLDELILWLASHAGNIDFVQREAQKLAKLVESQSPDRPAPIVSFVARQRDLRELIGESAPGAAELRFADILSWSEGRFHVIRLEDRNLPKIVEKRILKPKSEAARAEIDAAFESAVKMRAEVFETLVTREGDRALFRQVFPFSPALVKTLVALSSALQRERTAITILYQILIEEGPRIPLGAVVPVGVLWDYVGRDNTAFSSGLAHQFALARKLYQEKVRPMLELEHGVSLEEDGDTDGEKDGETGRAAARDPAVARRLDLIRRDDRLLKTLLLAAVVPEVEALRSLTPARLAALNHGSVKSIIPGEEGSEILSRLKRWKSTVNAIEIQGDPVNPTVSIHLSDVDTDAIIDSARQVDSYGARQRKLREILFEAFDVRNVDDAEVPHEIVWRGSRRKVRIVFTNVREAADPSLANDEDGWKVVVDFPFDESGHTPLEDLERVRRYRESGRSPKTIVWLPEFFSRKTQQELAKLVIVEWLLRADRLEEHTRHLKVEERVTARRLLENTKATSEENVKHALLAAYGVTSDRANDLLDRSFDMTTDRFQCFADGLDLKPPIGATLRDALVHLLDQALSFESPKHPRFETELKRRDIERVLEVVTAAYRSGEPSLYIEDRKLRSLLRQIADPLGMGRMGEERYQPLGEWHDHFFRLRTRSGKARVTVADLRAWMDEPEPRGLTPEVQDLLAISYAIETKATFEQNGAPVTPAIGKLSPDMELRPVRLPEKDEWEKARAVAESVCGATASKLLDAENVATLAARVRSALETRSRPELEGCGRASRSLPAEIRRRLGGLGVEDSAIAKAARVRTAEAVARLVASIEKSEDDDAALVRALANAEIVTSKDAMARSLKSAPEVLDRLRKADWTVFDKVKDIQGGRYILEKLRELLEDDECVQSVPGNIQALRDRALAIIIDQSRKPLDPEDDETPPRSVAVTPVPPVARGPDGRRPDPRDPGEGTIGGSRLATPGDESTTPSATVERGSVRVESAGHLDEVLSNLKKKLGRPGRHLEIEWTLYEDERKNDR